MAKQQEKNRPGENVGPIIQSNDPTVGKTAAQLSGTIGGWAWDGRRHCLVMLSCRHVFSNQQYKAVFGVNGLLADVFTTPTERPGYDLDASVADPLTPVTAKFEIQGLGMPAIFRIATFSQDTPVTAYSLMKGEKFTGTLRGAERLDAPLTSAGKQYDSKPYYALDADPGSEKGLVHGDSGTLVMAAENERSSLESLFDAPFACGWYFLETSRLKRFGSRAIFSTLSTGTRARR